MGRDLNPKASYAVIENGNAYIRKTSYDIERTVNDLERSTLPKKLTSKLSSMLYAGGIINLNSPKSQKVKHTT